MSWTTNVCGNGFTDVCQEVEINGRTLPTAKKFPEGVQWSVAGACQCGVFYSSLYPGGSSIVFTTGGGVCDDPIATKAALFNPPNAVCGNPPDYVSAMNWSIVKTEIIQGANSYEVNVSDFPHSGFLNNL